MGNASFVHLMGRDGIPVLVVTFASVENPRARASVPV